MEQRAASSNDVQLVVIALEGEFCNSKSTWVSGEKPTRFKSSIWVVVECRSSRKSSSSSNIVIIIILILNPNRVIITLTATIHRYDCKDNDYLIPIVAIIAALLVYQ